MNNIMRTLHPGVRWIFRFNTYSIFITIFFFVGLFGISIFLDGDLLGSLSNIGKAFLTILILIIIIGEIYARLAYQFWKYDFTNTELKIESGIIWKKYKSIPYQRIQNVEIHRGLIARICGFSNIAIHTAGYSAPVHRGIWNLGGSGAEGGIPSVSIEEGEKIRQFVMNKIGKKSGI